MGLYFDYRLARELHEDCLRRAERDRLVRQALQALRSGKGARRLAPQAADAGGIRWPEALVRFVELVNAGRYWHAHEALEEAWRANRSDFYHGLIIYASAFVHAQRGNPRGVLLQMGKVPRYLARYPDAYLGLDVAAILRHAEETCRRVREAGMPEGERLRAVVPWPTLTLDPARRSGQEPELTTA